MEFALPAGSYIPTPENWAPDPAGAPASNVKAPVHPPQGHRSTGGDDVNAQDYAFREGRYCAARRFPRIGGNTLNDLQVRVSRLHGPKAFLSIIPGPECSAQDFRVTAAHRIARQAGVRLLLDGDNCTRMRGDGEHRSERVIAKASAGFEFPAIYHEYQVPRETAMGYRR
ncbi:MAG: hypothetical protein JOY82_00170 [Streptosporangiaceae bacterium]|nr:hypothetical protein [Streptosporangiaceae bacterium]MBV9852930.1 hypothetical protein [Streptosporangiaceae bacterium]